MCDKQPAEMTLRSTFDWSVVQARHGVRNPYMDNRPLWQQLDEIARSVMVLPGFHRPEHEAWSDPQ